MDRNEINITDSEYPLIIEKIHDNNRTFNLIQDTYLPAGTKQRGLSFFLYLKQLGYNEIVTYGTVYGYGQVATAWCCKKLELKCTIFLPRVYPTTSMTRQASILGATIRYVDPDNSYPNTHILAMRARAYANKKSYRRLLNIGLDEKGYIEHLGNNISRVSAGINPKRIWVAGGSGVLARALNKAFPNTEICIVQVGRKIYTDVFVDINYKLYISPEKFRDPAKYPPPYKSLAHYDAKVWKFVEIYGEDGDFIWNVK